MDEAMLGGNYPRSSHQSAIKQTRFNLDGVRPADSTFGRHSETEHESVRMPQHSSLKKQQRSRD